MKLSVSLPPEDVAFLDEYVRTTGATTRSAALHAAVRLLRASRLGDEYAAAWQEWASVDADDWDHTIADGLAPDAPR